jgi:predicted transcriptional regulator
MPNSPKTPTRTLRVSDELWAAVKDKAQFDKRTVTDVIVESLKEYVDGWESSSNK